MRKKAIAGVIFAAILVALLLSWQFSSHLLWKYEVYRLGIKNVSAVPSFEMVASPLPNDWVRHRVGCLELMLPPDFAVLEAAPNGSSVAFQSGSRVVIVSSPTDVREFSPLLDTAHKLSPSGKHFTIPQLRSECDKHSSADFCWSMSSKEVRWLAFCITTNQLMRPLTVKHTEYYSRGDFDEIAHFGSDRVIIEWQSGTNGRFGFIHFVDRGETPDQVWIRAACQSLDILSE